ncbi:hypothetical protein DMN79_21135 [Vibrio parahaemolyticus]|nr:hypothetical protein [Vibrio parahaemolyticus]
MEKWIKERSHSYLRYGGKQTRRAQIRLLVNACNDIAANEPGVSTPPQIGRAHIHRYYARKSDLTQKTLATHFYAFRVLWQVLLKRPGDPPRPPEL